MTLPKKPTISSAADPTVMRILPELAKEIGLNESIALLQIAFWIKNANNLRDDRYWTYQSLEDMKEKAFMFWSRATINRVVNALQEKKLIDVGNYNQRRGDKTRWMALNAEGVSALTSVHIVWLTQDERLSQNETGRLKKKQQKPNLSQNETGRAKNETTLPETPTETPKPENISEIVMPSAAPQPQAPAAQHDDDKSNILPIEQSVKPVKPAQPQRNTSNGHTPKPRAPKPPSIAGGSPLPDNPARPRIHNRWKDLRTGRLTDEKQAAELALVNADLDELSAAILNKAMDAAEAKSNETGEPIYSWNFVRCFYPSAAELAKLKRRINPMDFVNNDPDAELGDTA